MHSNIHNVIKRNDNIRGYLQYNYFIRIDGLISNPFDISK